MNWDWFNPDKHLLDLVQQAKSGDPEAQAVLLKRHRLRVYTHDEIRLINLYRRKRGKLRFKPINPHSVNLPKWDKSEYRPATISHLAELNGKVKVAVIDGQTWLVDRELNPIMEAF